LNEGLLYLNAVPPNNNNCSALSKTGALFEPTF
jgi:hypothetical protein